MTDRKDVGLLRDGKKTETKHGRSEKAMKRAVT